MKAIEKSSIFVARKLQDMVKVIRKNHILPLLILFRLCLVSLCHTVYAIFHECHSKLSKYPTSGPNFREGPVFQRAWVREVPGHRKGRGLFAKIQPPNRTCYAELRYSRSVEKSSTVF